MIVFRMFFGVKEKFDMKKRSIILDQVFRQCYIYSKIKKEVAHAPTKVCECDLPKEKH